MKKLEQQEAFEILVQRMEMYLEKQQLEKGHYLIREGDSVHGLYFITFGEVTTHLENVDDKMVRLRTMGMGNIVGELGLYGGQVALASVVTKRPSTVYYLSEEKLKRMEEKDLEIAAELHKFVARHMGDRLATVTNTMKALLEY